LQQLCIFKKLLQFQSFPKVVYKPVYILPIVKNSFHLPSNTIDNDKYSRDYYSSSMSKTANLGTEAVDLLVVSVHVDCSWVVAMEATKHNAHIDFNQNNQHFCHFSAIQLSTVIDMCRVGCMLSSVNCTLGTENVRYKHKCWHRNSSSTEYLTRMTGSVPGSRGSSRPEENGLMILKTERGST